MFYKKLKEPLFLHTHKITYIKTGALKIELKVKNFFLLFFIIYFTYYIKSQKH